MLHIEICVSRAPGSLSVSSYSDLSTQTLAQAITEAEAFIAQCRVIQADRPPRPAASRDMGRIAADTWERLMDGSWETPIWQELKKL